MENYKLTYIKYIDSHCNSFNLDNNIITNPTSIANEFNHYFSNIGTKLDSSMKKTETNNFVKYLNIPHNSSFFNSHYF